METSERGSTIDTHHCKINNITQAIPISRQVVRQIVRQRCFYHANCLNAPQYKAANEKLHRASHDFPQPLLS